MTKLKKEQFNMLKRMVGIPSPFTQEDPKGDETELQDAIWEMLQEDPIRTSKQVIAESGRYNIIAQKGAPIEEAKYVVMVYVHTDTIKKKESWKDSIDYKLTRDGEFLRGIGVYDMKAGAMMLTEILQTIELPEGVTLVGAYCCGEERDSDGIEKLMEWPNIQFVNIVLSPEIGSVGNHPQDDTIMLETDNPKSIIVGRPGNVKSNLVVTAADSHAYKTDAPDAVDAWRELSNHLKRLFAERPDYAKEHPDFGKEFLRFRSVGTVGAGEFESVATELRSRIAIRITSPTTMDSIRIWQQEALDALLDAAGDWSNYGLDAQFTRAGMSYNPYIVRTDSPDVQAVAEAARKHYGGYKFTAGQAVADGALGHWAMNKKRDIDPKSSSQYAIDQLRTPDDPVPDKYVPWIDIGPLGQGAHKKTERVYEESLVNLIAFYRYYLTEHLSQFLADKD